MFINILNTLFVIYFFTSNIKHGQCKKSGNVYSAIAHMEPLVEIERRLISLARNYIEKERHELAGLKQFADQVDEAMQLSKDEPIKYLGNPINSYLIIKRFTSGWVDLADRLNDNDEAIQDINDLLTANDMYLPTYEQDMVGATQAIFRLQDTYNITAREISDGKIRGVRPSTHQFSARDCLDIAEGGHYTQKYVRMQEWLQEANRLMQDPMLEHRQGDIELSELYEYMGWGFYLANNMTEALRFTDLLLELDPESDFAIRNKKIYTFYVERNLTSQDEESTYVDRAQLVLDHFVNSSYVKACRNNTPEMRSIVNMSNIKSFYHSSSPRYILKPAKVTQYHDNPEVYLFHDVLHEWESRKLKEIATPRLRPAEVIDQSNDEHITADYRVSKNLFFDTALPEDRNISNYIDGRIEELTGLSMYYAENYQVNNYGLGGQYEFHIDHGPPGTYLDNHRNGNRLATLLFYLSDVEKGGHTVFTKLGLTFYPKRGDAVFWYNLFRNGTGNYETQHASCPVLSGSKWVVNKWIHAHGNEFNRRCTLNQME